MRTRDLIRELRKLGIPENEIKSTIDLDELLALRNKYTLKEQDNAAIAYFSQYSIMFGLIVLFYGLLSIVCWIYPIRSYVDKIVPTNRTQVLILSFLSLVASGQVQLAIIRLIQLVLEWYNVYARLSAFLSWVIPADSPYSRWLAPTLYFPLSLNPSNPVMNIGPVIVLFCCNYTASLLEKYAQEKLVLKNGTIFKIAKMDKTK
jgi:hypothetical protein